MRTRPYAFLKVGKRWINMAMVTDIEDHGDNLVVTADMARLAGLEDPSAVDVARRFSITDADQVDKVRKWLRFNDEE